MKVIECTAYGSSAVLTLCQRPKPVPTDGQVLVKVHATTVTAGDWRIRSLQMPPGFRLLARPIFGFLKPRQPVLGSEAAGEVVATGSGVAQFKAGDRVVLFDGVKMGCHAEFKLVNATGCIVRIPDSLDDQTAAALPFGGTTAVHFLRKTGVSSGDRVLVIGASGNVGSSLVQLARQIGASVTGVCSAANTELVRSLGAEQVLDYESQDILTSGLRFDAVFETVGALNLAQTLTLVRDGGRAAIIAGGLGDIIRSTTAGKARKIRVVAGPAAERVEDLRHLVDLASESRFRPVIDAVYPLEAIAQAHDRVESRRKRGSVVVLIG